MARKPHPDTEDPLQRIVKKLPSDQIARVMEFYDNRVLQVLCEHTDIGMDIAARCLSFVVRNRRKVTPASQSTAIAALTYGMLYPRYLATVLKALRIERSLIFGAVTPERLTTLSKPVAHHLKLLLIDLERFRTAVIQRYKPLAVKQASSFVWARGGSGITLENSDTTQNFMLAVIRGVDKFDVDSGTLTTYVALWMKNSWNSAFNIPLGESFSVSRSARGRIARQELAVNNHSVDLEQAEHITDESGAFDGHLLDAIEGQNYAGFLAYAQHSGLLKGPFSAMAMAALYPLLKPAPSVLGLPAAPST